MPAHGESIRCRLTPDQARQLADLGCRLAGWRTGEWRVHETKRGADRTLARAESGIRHYRVADGPLRGDTTLAGKVGCRVYVVQRAAEDPTVEVVLLDPVRYERLRFTPGGWPRCYGYYALRDEGAAYPVWRWVPR